MSDTLTLTFETPSTRFVEPYDGPSISGTMPPTRFAARHVVSGDEGGDRGGRDGGQVDGGGGDIHPEEGR
mgnify:CR=1 FL=1